MDIQCFKRTETNWFSERNGHGFYPQETQIHSKKWQVGPNYFWTLFNTLSAHVVKSSSTVHETDNSSSASLYSAALHFLFYIAIIASFGYFCWFLIPFSLGSVLEMKRPSAFQGWLPIILSSRSLAKVRELFPSTSVF